MAYNTIQKLMPTNRLLQEIVKIPAVRDLKVTVNSAIKSGAIVGAATILSGILAGPRGVAIGIYFGIQTELIQRGVMSSILTSYFTHGTYRSAPDILINDTTPAQREKLAAILREYFATLPVGNIRDMVMALQSNEIVMQTVMQIMITFLTSTMGLSVIKT